MGKSKRWLAAVLAATMVIGLFQSLIRADAVYYSITVGESEHGTVTVNKENSQAAWSDLVTLTIVCEENYKVDTVTYVTEEGKSFTADPGSIGEWIFPMPNSNVTVNITYKLTKIITVDFGAGHEDFVQKNFSGVDGLVVDGSLVTFVYDPVDPDYAHAANAKNQFLNGFGYDIQDPMDDGEMYMRDIALKPIEDYADMSEYQEEQLTLGNIPTEDCVTFYALWAKPVTDAVITVEPLTCGTVVTLNSRGSTAQTDPAPVLTATGGLHFSDYQLFFNNWDIAGLDSIGDSITVKGGTPCTATCFLEADWGYYLPEDLESAITVEGGYSFELGYWNLDNGLAIEVPSVHVEGDNAVIVPATCTEDGSKTYTCTECQEEVVEVLEATGHDWGEWVVVKPATVDEEGLEVRTCLNDPEHTESRVIPKLTPEPAPSEDEPAPPAGDLYNLTSGGGEYVIGSKEDYTLIIKRSVDDASCYSHFTGTVKIDDNALGDGDYTSKPGSTIISIIPSTMDKLSAGEHVITVVFDDGEVSFTINVRAAQNEAKAAPAPATVPATGEMAAPVTTAGVILCLSAAAIFVTAVTVRRRKHVRE